MAKEEPADEQRQLEQAMAHLESQRPTLGDAVVDSALAPLRARLAKLSGGTVDAGGQGERRVVTVVFCDVVGSTALAEGMDPEAWTQIMNAAFERLTEPIERFGGQVARLLGDAVLAFFGAPLAHEDDPQRAVSAGLAMIEAIAPFRDELQHAKGLDFAVRVGINTGLAVVGRVGSETASEYTVMGDAVNVAARMEQTAAPGTVQIGHDTYALVAPLFECQPLGGIEVKGKSQPVQAYRVLARKAQPGSLRGLADHGIGSALVGREAELGACQQAVRKLMAGKGGIVAIFGEAGIGKSRLLAELKRSAEKGANALAWLEGQTLSYGQAISYWPFQEILRSAAAITEDDGEDEAWDKLSAVVGRMFAGEATEVLPYLGSILALQPPDEYVVSLRYLEADELKRQVYRATWRFFQRCAEERPLVMVLDDLHWMDASSAELMEHLLPLAGRVPMLLIGLSRPEPDTPGERLRSLGRTEYADRFTEIALPPLSLDDSDRLVHNLLDIDGLPQHVRQMMVRKADGNPFYLEEIVRSLIETGAIVREPSSGRWQATSAAERVTVPDTIQGLIMARIDRLDNDLKHVLRRAAVIGRAFLVRVLSAVVADEAGLEHRLWRLEQVQLILERQRLPELEYVFKHALAQQAAYGSILHQERRLLHARVAAALEELMADRLEEFYGLLAYHYSASEQWEQAQDYLFKAGDQAWRLAADAEALAHYRQAIEAYGKARGDDWEPLERARLERKIGEALYRLGRHSQARPYLERSLALLGEEVPASRGGTRLALVRALLVQVAHRVLPRLFAQPSDSELDAAGEEIYLASMALGGVEWASNPERYALLNLRALNASESRGYLYGSATLAANMGLALLMFSRFGPADRYYRLSQEYAGRMTSDRPFPQLALGLAGRANLLANFEQMEEHSIQAMALARRTGHLRIWGMAAVNLAYSKWGRGNFEAAADLLEELLASAEESSDRQLTCWALLAHGCVLRRSGQVEQSIQAFEESWSLAEELSDSITLAGACGWLARSYVAMGQLKQAVSVAEACERTLSEGIGSLAGYTYLGLGLLEAYLTLAEQSQGDERRAWLRKSDRVRKRTLKAAKRLTRMGWPDALRFQGRHEWLAGDHRSARNWWGRALSLAEELGMRYEVGMTHLEIGRFQGDRQHLRQAVSTLEEIGAAFDLAAAREALAGSS